MVKDCQFCNILKEEIVIENEHCFAKWDKYPVSKGHLLIIPYRHYKNYFYSTQDEIEAIGELIREAGDLINNKYNPDGYNVGINVGQSAGQTVPHVHIHLIPRYKGDVDDPKGGVRGVIPGKQKY